MPAWIHRLSEKDLINKTAICSHCGPVKIKVKNGPSRKGIPSCQCMNAWNAGRRGVYLSSVLEKPEKCQICNKKRRLVLDHKHGKKTMRGWICHQCNIAIGMVGEDVEVLKRMIEYIGRIV